MTVRVSLRDAKQSERKRDSRQSEGSTLRERETHKVTVKEEIDRKDR